MSRDLKHLAVIMDGNSRWAEAKRLPKMLGHRRGVQAAKDLVINAIKNNISYLSLYAVSTENLLRPQSEVNYLIKLLETYIDQEAENFNRHGIKLHIIGNLAILDQNLQSKIQKVMLTTKSNTKLTLYIAFCYGGRDEIVDACRNAIKSKIVPEDLTKENFQQFLYASDMPEIDLVIRTGGEKRFSNFLPWHIAYAELCLIDKYWPDFNEDDLMQALSDFTKRVRRFGRRS